MPYWFQRLTFQPVCLGLDRHVSAASFWSTIPITATNSPCRYRYIQKAVEPNMMLDHWNEAAQPFAECLSKFEMDKNKTPDRSMEMSWNWPSNCLTLPLWCTLAFVLAWSTRFSIIYVATSAVGPNARWDKTQWIDQQLALTQWLSLRLCQGIRAMHHAIKPLRRTQCEGAIRMFRLSAEIYWPGFLTRWYLDTSFAIYLCIRSRTVVSCARSLVPRHRRKQIVPGPEWMESQEIRSKYQISFEQKLIDHRIIPGDRPADVCKNLQTRPCRQCIEKWP